jgi:hypothetical protein
VGVEIPAKKSKSGVAVQGLLGLVVLSALLCTGPKVDLSEDWSTREYGETILGNAGPNALIFGWWDIVPVIQYLQLVEHQRPDVKAINRFLISYEDLTSLALQEAEKRPVYIDEIPPTWKTMFESQVVGEVSRIWLPSHSGTPQASPTEAK